MDDVERFIELLGRKSATARRYAALKLGSFKNERTAAAAIGALKDIHPEVRQNAARALGEIGDVSAVPHLIEALKNGNPRLRYNAAWALGEIGDPSAVRALIGALEDEDWRIRFNVVEALEKIIEKCETIEALERVEKGIGESSVTLREGLIDKGTLINLQIKIAKLTREIAERKDELAPKRDLLLDDKPKPPKKGRGVYQTARMVRNG